jgi:hypothetical protein
MYIKVLFGAHEGQVLDIEPETARELLKSGRAENPFQEPVTLTLPEIKVTIPAAALVDDEDISRPLQKAFKAKR